jgi:hypothetical protein
MLWKYQTKALAKVTKNPLRFVQRGKDAFSFFYKKMKAYRHPQFAGRELALTSARPFAICTP